MWIYEKKLEYPVKIYSKDLRMAKYLMTQYGGPDGELSAAIRYLNKTSEDKKFIVLTTGMINSRKILNSMRQGKYKYLAKDKSFIKDGNANNFQLKSDEILTFKEFDDQTNK